MISNKEKYFSLATRKRDGHFVETPVWFAECETPGIYYVFSLNNAGKVKRLKNFSESRVAACTFRGVITGPWYDAETVLVDDPAEIDRANEFFDLKYRWTIRVSNFFSKLVGNYRRRQYIKVTLL